MDYNKLYYKYKLKYLNIKKIYGGMERFGTPNPKPQPKPQLTIQQRIDAINNILNDIDGKYKSDYSKILKDINNSNTEITNILVYMRKVDLSQEDRNNYDSQLNKLRSRVTKMQSEFKKKSLESIAPKTRISTFSEPDYDWNLASSDQTDSTDIWDEPHKVMPKVSSKHSNDVAKTMDKASSKHSNDATESMFKASSKLSNDATESMFKASSKLSDAAAMHKVDDPLDSINSFLDQCIKLNQAILSDIHAGTKINKKECIDLLKNNLMSLKIVTHDIERLVQDGVITEPEKIKDVTQSTIKNTEKNIKLLEEEPFNVSTYPSETKEHMLHTKPKHTSEKTIHDSIDDEFTNLNKFLADYTKETIEADIINLKKFKTRPKDLLMRITHFEEYIKSNTISNSMYRQLLEALKKKAETFRNLFTHRTRLLTYGVNKLPDNTNIDKYITNLIKTNVSLKQTLEREVALLSATPIEGGIKIPTLMKHLSNIDSIKVFIESKDLIPKTKEAYYKMLDDIQTEAENIKTSYTMRNRKMTQDKSHIDKMKETPIKQQQQQREQKQSADDTIKSEILLEVNLGTLQEIRDKISRLISDTSSSLYSDIIRQYNINPKDPTFIHLGPNGKGFLLLLRAETNLLNKEINLIINPLKKKNQLCKRLIIDKLPINKKQVTVLRIITIIREVFKLNPLLEDIENQFSRLGIRNDQIFKILFESCGTPDPHQKIIKWVYDYLHSRILNRTSLYIKPDIINDLRSLLLDEIVIKRKTPDQIDAELTLLVGTEQIVAFKIFLNSTLKL